MPRQLFFATDRGVVRADPQGEGWEISLRSLEDQQVTAIIAREGVVLAGTTRGVFRSSDRGASWEPASQGLDHPHIRWLAYHPDHSDFELAGTEPAGIYISRDGGDLWQGAPEVARMRQEYGWYLPYSPEAGAVRGFAAHGERLYAAVEVGGVLISTDRGGHWELAPGSPGPPAHHQGLGQVHPDVHSIEVHPSSPMLVYAPTGGGFFVSQDGGQVWSPRYPRCYCRAVWVDPEDPQRMILGPADGVDRNGRIEQSRDGGLHWENASAGLDTPWARTMVERFAQVEGWLFAIRSDGRLLRCSLEELRWQEVLPGAGRVRALASLEATE